MELATQRGNVVGMELEMVGMTTVLVPAAVPAGRRWR